MEEKQAQVEAAAASRLSEQDPYGGAAASSLQPLPATQGGGNPGSLGSSRVAGLSPVQQQQRQQQLQQQHQHQHLQHLQHQHSVQVARGSTHSPLHRSAGSARTAAAGTAAAAEAPAEAEAYTDGVYTDSAPASAASSSSSSSSAMDTQTSTSNLAPPAKGPSATVLTVGVLALAGLAGAALYLFGTEAHRRGMREALASASAAVRKQVSGLGSSLGRK